MDFKRKIAYYYGMRIKFHSHHSWELKCVFICCACMFLSSYQSVVSADRPAPRKPFVSKAATSAAAIHPLHTNSSEGAKGASSANTTLKNSGQAEILMITRSHKPPSVRPVVPDQTGGSPTSSQATDTPIRSGAGSQAQVGKIIERQ